MTKEANVLRELSDGVPVTAYQLAVALDWPVKIASAHVTNLLQRGKVEHAGQVRQVDGARLAWLYKIKRREKRKP
jgi:hypothetical protein